MNYKREEFLLLRNMPAAVLEAAKKTDCFLIGGSIASVFTGRMVNDYDFYFRDEVEFHAFEAQLMIHAAKHEEWKAKSPKKKAKKARPTFAKLMFSTDNANSWIVNDCKVQLIRYEKFFGSPDQIWHYFDFTVCMGAYSFKLANEPFGSFNPFIFHDDFLAHNAERRIVFQASTEYPISSLIRVQKYLRYGYKINSLELIKIALTINSLQLSDYRAIKKQLMGIDTLFLKPLTDWLDKRSDEAFDLVTFMAQYETTILEAYHIDPGEIDDTPKDNISTVTSDIFNM